MGLRLSSRMIEACFFPIPASPRILEIVSFFPDVDLKQELAKWQRLVLVLVGSDERFERHELGVFDIDLQDVDELVACGRILNRPNGYGCEVIGRTVRLKEGLKGVLLQTGASGVVILSMA